MRVFTILLASTVSLLLVSCHKGENTKSTTSAAHKPSNGKADPEVIAKRRAMGRWRSRPHMLPGTSDRWLILDLAGTGDARMEIRSQSDRGPLVSAFSVGHYQITPTGILGWFKATGPLADFSWWHATFPSSATMVLHSDRTGGGGPVIDMTYDGA